jgi:hypothetical protein
MINMTPDVNFFLDACRFRDNFGQVLADQNDTMRALVQVVHAGPRAGLVLNTGRHVLNNVAKALRSPEASFRGPTRDAWPEGDIQQFLEFVQKVVAATGGRLDGNTVSHDQALGLFASAGAPDAEDYQMLMLAVNSGSTVLVTSDADLLALDSFQGVEVWPPSEMFGEVRANFRRWDQR